MSSIIWFIWKFLRNSFYNPIFSFLGRSIKSLINLNKYRKNNINIGPNVLIKNCKFGKFINIGTNSNIINCNIGDYSYCAYDCNIQFTNIGKYCSIAARFVCGLTIHPLDRLSTHPMFYQKGFGLVKEDVFKNIKEIEIGNDVRIGTNVIIKDGIKVGDGAVIAAGAMVVKDVEPYSVVGGIPAKLIKYRFDEKTIKKLLEIKRWDKNDEYIKKHLNKFTKSDIKLEDIVNL